MQWKPRAQEPRDGAVGDNVNDRPHGHAGSVGWLPRWFRIWPTHNGTRPLMAQPSTSALDGASFRASQLNESIQNGGARFHFTDLLPYGADDWYTLGTKVGRHGGDLNSLLLCARSYLTHNSKTAAKQLTTLEELSRRLQDPDTFADEVAEDEAVLAGLRAEATSLKNDLQGLEAEQTEPPGHAFAEHLRKNQESYAEFLSELNLTVRGDVAGRIQRAGNHLQRTFAMHEEFEARTTRLQQAIMDESDVDIREALRDQLRQVEEEWRRGLDFRKEVFAGLQSQTELVDSWCESLVGAAKRFITEDSKRDQEVLELAAATTTEPTLVRSRLYVVAFGFAVVVAMVGEFAVMNHYTGSALGVGRFTDYLTDIIAGRDRAASALQAVFVLMLALLPFAFGFFIKAQLDEKTQRRGNGSRWISWGLTMAGLGYFATLSTLVGLVDRSPFPRNLATGLIVFFFSTTLVLLNGWLLHHFFRAFSRYRQVTQGTALREARLQAALLRVQEQISTSQAEARRRRDQRDRSRLEIENQIAALRVYAENSGKVGEKDGTEAVLAAIKAGYREGMIARAGGDFRDQDSAIRESLDDLSLVWRKMQILASLQYGPPRPDDTCHATGAPKGP